MLVVASAGLCGLSWIDWWFTRSTWLGVPYPILVAGALAANLRANPNVRVCARHGWRRVWRTGTAHPLTDDDPYAR
jgi:hypothetical protein